MLGKHMQSLAVDHLTACLLLQLIRFPNPPIDHANIANAGSIRMVPFFKTRSNVCVMSRSVRLAVRYLALRCRPA